MLTGLLLLTFITATGTAARWAIQLNSVIPLMQDTMPCRAGEQCYLVFAKQHNSQ